MNFIKVYLLKVLGLVNLMKPYLGEKCEVCGRGVTWLNVWTLRRGSTPEKVICERCCKRSPQASGRG